MIELAPNIPTSRTVSEHMSLGHTQSDFNGEKIGGNFILTQMLNWSQWMVELVVFVRANWHLTIKSLISWLGAVILWHFLLFHGSRSNDHANQCSEKKIGQRIKCIELILGARVFSNLANVMLKIDICEHLFPFWVWIFHHSFRDSVLKSWLENHTNFNRTKSPNLVIEKFCFRRKAKKNPNLRSRFQVPRSLNRIFIVKVCDKQNVQPFCVTLRIKPTKNALWTNWMIARESAGLPCCVYNPK